MWTCRAIISTLVENKEVNIMEKEMSFIVNSPGKGQKASSSSVINE
jgi:hypothetical protein